MEITDQEAKLLEILNQPELPSPTETKEDTEAVVEEAFPGLDPKMKEAMSKIMAAEMPSPEEIEKAEKIARHNRELREKRELKQREKKQRREAIGSRSRKHRKRRKK